MNQDITLVNDIEILSISGFNNNIKIKSHIGIISISGYNNVIDGQDPNCLVDIIDISGMNNEISLNQNCSRVISNISGFQNELIIVNSYNNNYGNNYNEQNININSNENVNNNINNALLNYMEINQNMNENIDNSYSSNNTNDSNDMNNIQNNNIVEPEFDRKKQQLILEMDEFQYKHILKYDSRKETKCSICLNEFDRTDIIKSFYKCEHIFHKSCLLNWLKKSNICPLCKHDLKDDIK